MSTGSGEHSADRDVIGRDGEQNFAEGRGATTGSAGRRRGRRGRGGGRGRGERAMVPEAQFTSYYGRPIVKPSPWTSDIPAYLFAGGLAGGSALLGAGGDLTGRPALRRVGRLGAFGAITASLGFLVHDLGRPSRFINMLRVAKVTSPMSVGTWILTAFAPAAGAAALAELRPILLPSPTGATRTPSRLLDLAGRPAGLAAAAIAPAVMSYTAVLLTDTATPSWHEGYREMPWVFVGSSFLAAGGLAMVAAPVQDAGPARRMACVGALLELAADHRMESSMGLAAEPLHGGSAGPLMRASKLLTLAGAAGTLLTGRDRRLAAVSGSMLIAASACTRFAIFHAGQQSALDPKYTVIPQRQRVTDRAGEADAAEMS